MLLYRGHLITPPPPPFDCLTGFGQLLLTAATGRHVNNVDNHGERVRYEYTLDNNDNDNIVIIIVLSGGAANRF